MADITPLDEVDHVFGDIRGVISDPFQIAGNQEKVETARDRTS